ncbi:FmdB family zinc ribbon protein [Longispora fulva]|uniref:Putative FmdB family regulatory protein n=1 Tax=Longispora fulva TaxID=619741 RepID=A0A8J7H0U9_9ACTN|nr:FmdB family zinc ribbon protein [Longispora fulva]MBG6140263.1 putative FmdB family regulatory protein [Longispora fulva]
MPTYQYACTECGHQLEAVQSFSDDALTTCPECTGKLRKLFSAVGVVFKGSGWAHKEQSTKPALAAPKQATGESAPAAAPVATPATTSAN